MHYKKDEQFPNITRLPTPRESALQPSLQVSPANFPEVRYCQKTGKIRLAAAAGKPQTVRLIETAKSAAAPGSVSPSR